MGELASEARLRGQARCDSAGLTPVDEATAEMCGQVIYPAAVLKAAPNAEAAREFLAYLQTDRAATVFEGVGFTAM